MALTKYRLGDLIELLNERNTAMQYGIDYVRGVNNLKQLMPTKADLTTRDISKFQIVYPQDFVFNHRTSRNGDKFSIAFNDTDLPVICTEDYVVFRVKEDSKHILLPLFLYIYFNRSEFDRYVIMNSWGSSTEFYNWEDICDIMLDLPDITIQQKYVNIYLSMLENQRCYETALDDLKLVCDAYFDMLKKDKTLQVSLGEIIERNDTRNSDGLFGIENVRGISNQKKFVDTKADIKNTDLTSFLVIGHNQFAYNSRTDGRDMLVLAINQETTPVIVTKNYNSFKIREVYSERVNPIFIYTCLNRAEFDRLVRFMSWGSTQEQLSWDSLCEITIPLPNIEIQNSIADISSVLIERKKINEQLKAQIKDICPILIRGAVKEAETM